MMAKIASNGTPSIRYIAISRQRKPAESSLAIGRDGKVVDRFPSKVTPEVATIEKALGENDPVVSRAR
jgi:hypothetical protein